MSVPQGHYEITLAPGRYDLIFHYLGYETLERTIEVQDTWIELSVTLKTQVIQLQSVTVKAGKEDPA